MDNFFQQAIAHHSAMTRQFFNDPFFTGFGGGGFGDRGGGGGRGGGGSRREPPRRQAAPHNRQSRPSRQARRCELPPQQLRMQQQQRAGGTTSTLAREGITAARPFSSSGGTFSSPSSSSSTTALGGGWFKKSNPPNSSFKRCGSHVVVTSSGSGGKSRPFFVASFANVSTRKRTHRDMSVGKKWDLRVKVKTTEPRGYSSSAQSSSENNASPRRFHVVFGWSESSFFTLVGDAGLQRWHVEKIRTRRGGGVVGKKIIASEADDDLKTNRFYAVSLCADGEDFEIYVNGRRLFAEFEEETGDALGALVEVEGEVGVGAHQSKTIFKEFELDCPDNVEPKYSSPSRSETPQLRLKDSGGSKTTTTLQKGKPDKGKEQLTQDDHTVLQGVDPSLAVTVERDIVHHSTGVSFDDVVGLKDAKRLLKEAVTLPLLLPESKGFLSFLDFLDFFAFFGFFLLFWWSFLFPLFLL